MGNTDKNNSKKCRRKIKIRLADPNIPDSYVCEVFDSSLENEEENSKNEEVLEEKPKNYFELLMPKKCGKNRVINNYNENKNIKQGSCKLFDKNKKKNQKNLNLSTHLNVGKKESNCEVDSSEDESLFQIREKYSLKRIDPKEENECVIEITNEISNKNGNNKTIFSENEPPKEDLSHKKALGILSYFSKTQTNLKNKENCDLEEITVLNHSFNTCKTAKALKPTQECEKIPLNSISKGNVKLAPLFCKKESKVIDSATKKARLDFLYKSSPSLIKKSDNKVLENVYSFPAVSHVQQRNDSVCWSHRTVDLPLPELSNSDEWVLNSNKKFSLEIKHLNSDNNTVANYAVKINKEFLSKAKCKYLELNLDLVIDGLKEKKDKFSARVEEIEKLKSSQDSNENYEELNVLWTEKYKPKSSEILGNENITRKMKKWLESWKSFDEELKALVRNRSLKNVKEEDDDSDDDFLDSESENYGLKSPSNVCIVSGPNGCGKTALVYALASELEFGVLELNAGSKRTGKKVLSDLQEATQSHKVHRVNLLQTDKCQAGIKKKRGRKKKRIKKLDLKKLPDQSNDSKISLILIEDADIVFEDHDEGFFSSIATLVQTSKRPLIFLTNEPNCHHLYNLKPEQCLILEMELPNFYISCAILDIVSSLEGASFAKEVLESVLRQNNFDLRKSLLEMQFWMHSGKNPIDFHKKFDLGQLWWGLSKFLFKQDMRHFVKPKSRKRKRMNDLFDSSDEEIEVTAKKFKPDVDLQNISSLTSSNLIQNKANVPIESYFKVLDLASSLDCFSLPGSQEPVPGFEYKARDSLSLDENMEETTWNRNGFGELISNEIVLLTENRFRRENGNENENRKLNFVSPCWEEIRWRNSQEKAAQELSTLVTLHRGRDNRSLHLDYLPTLRNICRIERNRSEMNPKRKNRFYHYLNNLGLELTDENLEINCDVFNR